MVEAAYIINNTKPHKMRTVNSLLIIIKEMYVTHITEYPRHKTGLCSINRWLNENKESTPEEYELIKDYYKEHLPTKHLTNMYNVPNHDLSRSKLTLYCWDSDDKESRLNWLDENILLTTPKAT